jgi:hypothetical protein
VNKKSLVIIFLICFVNFFYQVNAATSCVKNQDRDKAANFLEKQSPFLDSISSQDCKNLLQVLRCHELILEHFVAECLSREFASNKGMDSIDFDLNQVNFLEQERISFEGLSPQVKAFFDNMQDFIRDSGTGFDFRTIHLLFEMRSDFLKITIKYLDAIISFDQVLSSSLNKDEFLKQNGNLKLFKKVFEKKLMVDGKIYTLTEYLSEMKRRLSADTFFLDYSSISETLMDYFIKIEQYCANMKKFFIQQDESEIGARQKIILKILEQQLNPLIDASRSFMELKHLFGENYSEFQEYIANFYNKIGLFKSVYAMLYNALYNKISDPKSLFSPSADQFAGVALPETIFLFHQKQNDLFFCKSAFDMLQKMKNIIKQHFRLIKLGDGGFNYRVTTSFKLIKDLEGYIKETSLLFTKDVSFKTIFSMSWLSPSTLVDEYAGIKVPKISLKFLSDFYKDWFKQRAAFLEKCMSRSQKKPKKQRPAQPKKTKKKYKTKKRVQVKSLHEEDSSSGVPEADLCPDTKITVNCEHEPVSEIPQEVFEESCAELEQAEASTSSAAVVRTSKRKKFTDITKEFWSYVNDLQPRAKKLGSFATWVLSWNLFNEEGMTFVLYPVHTNQIRFSEFSFECCESRNAQKCELSDKFHKFPKPINDYLNYGYVIDFDDPKTLDIFKQNFPNLQKQLSPAKSCFAVAIEAKITSKHHFRSYLNEADIRSTQRMQRELCEHNGMIVWIFDKSRKICFHKCFHEFEESYRITHKQ